jgi:hypothetical protein
VGVRRLHNAARPSDRGRPRRRRDLTDPDFPHGQPYGYQLGCRSECCGEAHRLAHNRWLKRLAAQSWGGPVPESPRDRFPAWFVRDRVVALRERFTGKQVALLTGVHHTTIETINHGRTHYVRRDVRDKIMAVPVDVARPDTPEFLPGRLPAAWVEQMIGSLNALGWPTSWVTEQCGFAYRRTWRETDAAWTTRRTYLRIKAVYEAVGDRPGPSERTRILAHKAGWRVPGAYENHVLIPGAALVDGDPDGEVEATRERRARVLLLTERGLTAPEIAAEMGLDARQVRKDREAERARQARQRMTLAPEPGRMTG